ALASGIIERIGSQSLITLRNLSTGATSKSAMPIRDHRSAIDHVLRWLVSPAAAIAGVTSLHDIHAVGHRVVHGGERFAKSVVIDDEVLKGLEDMIDLAPLHNPANISGIRAAKEVLGAGIAQAAVFDTAFHHTLPEQAYLYAIPYQYYRRYKVRRYGFHGTSHRYVSYRYRMLCELPRKDVYAITLHLGNGCSACAIAGGNSIDTSMGMTPLEGLVMGTRAGDIDPAIMDYLSQKEGVSLHEIDSILNRSSGLLGISGLTHDMRELIDEEKEHDDRRSRLAIEIFCYRARKYIGSYITSILATGANPERIAIIFTGGIGENSPDVRARICHGLGWLGLELDEEKNRAMTGGKEGAIGDGRLKPYVIPTNEELLIARDTVRAINHIPQRY
ncbi:MAG TPA: acetate kinase, partial [Candidatus Kapabacteria bacterium]|nr:acetate kinase [Candidatus Kapabacteria bacterium]